MGKEAAPVLSASSLWPPPAKGRETVSLKKGECRGKGRPATAAQVLYPQLQYLLLTTTTQQGNLSGEKATQMPPPAILIPSLALHQDNVPAGAVIRNQAGETEGLCNSYIFICAHSSISRRILLLLLTRTIISLAKTRLSLVFPLGGLVRGGFSFSKAGSCPAYYTISVTLQERKIAAT